MPDIPIEFSSCACPRGEHQSGQAGGRLTHEEIVGIRWLKKTGGQAVITDRQLYALLDAAERDLATVTPRPSDPKPA